MAELTYRGAIAAAIAQEMERHRLCIRGHVEHFALTDPGQMAGRHIADRVCASLARRQSHLGQAAHHIRNIPQFHKVQLDILTRRHMPHPRSGSLRQFCDPSQLIRRQAAERYFDPKHLNAALALAIDTVLQTERLEDVAGQVAREETL